MRHVTITRGTTADIPRLEPPWVAVHHQHVASMPELAPYVSDAETWRERRALYEELFRKPDTFLLLARLGDELVGYALVHSSRSRSCPNIAARGSEQCCWTNPIGGSRALGSVT